MTEQINKALLYVFAAFMGIFFNSTIAWGAYYGLRKWHPELPEVSYFAMMLVYLVFRAFMPNPNISK